MYKAICPGYIGHPSAFSEVAQAVSRHGYEGYWFSLVTDSALGAQKTRDLLKQYALKAAGFDLPLDFRGGEDAYQEGMRRLPELLDFAAAIGANRAVTWIVPFSDTRTYEENFAFHVERLSPIARMLEDRGISFGLEFCGPQSLRDGKKHEFLYTLDGALALGDALGTKNMGVLMDVYHWCLAGHTDKDFARFTRPDQITLVHINDAVQGIPFEKQEDLVRRLPGASGLLPVRDFLTSIQSLGYDGPVIVEPFDPMLARMSMDEAFSAVMDSMNAVWP